MPMSHLTRSMCPLTVNCWPPLLRGINPPVLQGSGQPHLSPCALIWEVANTLSLQVLSHPHPQPFVLNSQKTQDGELENDLRQFLCLPARETVEEGHSEQPRIIVARALVPSARSHAEGRRRKLAVM